MYLGFHTLDFLSQVQRWLRSADGPVESQIPPSDPSHWQPLLPQGDAEQEGGCELENEEDDDEQKMCLCFLVKSEPCLSLSDARTDDDVEAGVCTLIITAETLT